MTDPKQNERYSERDYDQANLPPATPPVIDTDADPVSSRELAEDGGDSDSPGNVPAEAPVPDRGDGIASPTPDEISTPGDDTIKPGHAPDEISPDRLDGAGEQTHDAVVPLTQLPPD